MRRSTAARSGFFQRAPTRGGAPPGRDSAADGGDFGEPFPLVLDSLGRSRVEREALLGERDRRGQQVPPTARTEPAMRGPEPGDAPGHAHGEMARQRRFGAELAVL